MLRGLVAVFAIGLSAPLSASVQLVPVLSTGLSSPVFLANAQDGSNRVFIVEQGGIVRVLQPGASAPTVFLDIRAKVIAGGEQGLLGLAFHPQHAVNGRYFVYYTRRGDGALVIAEYQVSFDPTIADPIEVALLTIAHPVNTNHNGGMLAFGHDGYLYIGVGDGGAGNDPPDNAQNIESLLGKILRIDVDRPDNVAGTRYSAPADNLFVDRPGRDEIYALGMRNPWRFSFDRATGQQWVADVGQNAREEVNSPIVNGGNYGWRVYEGTRCTNNDPALCDPADYIAPLFEYANGGGRCSITGGYVYRGTLGTLQPGTYVYGDYCSGEIFAWNGSTQTLLLDTTLAIASFGEDEQGELYVVDLAGSISKIVADTPTPISAVEYFHAAFGHYFVTASPEEIAKLSAGAFTGWAPSGHSFNVYPIGAPGSIAMCRFFSASFAPKSSHFYTPLASECGTVKQNTLWQFEGEVFGVQLPDASGNCAIGLQALYRLYNAGQGGAPNHRYTTSLATRNAMVGLGWIPEGHGALGVIACVPPQ